MILCSSELSDGVVLVDDENNPVTKSKVCHL